jgi:hypothetical protein
MIRTNAVKFITCVFNKGAITVKLSILAGLSILALSVPFALPTTAAEQPTHAISQQINNKQSESEYERVRLELLEDLDRMFEQKRQEMMADTQLDQMRDEMVRAVNERFRKAAEERINRN